MFKMESGWSTLVLGAFTVVFVQSVAGEWNGVFKRKYFS
jgi:hypothetical protein